jgi:aspartyl-tRNA(Asn)/glutamyl-tRNA(Gln) amidotransferase subunit A
MRLILAPTAPSAAFAWAKRAAIRWRCISTTCSPCRLAGRPARDVGAGGLDREGLPLGLQMIGKAFDEQGVLNAGLAIEAQGRAEFTAQAGEVVVR